MQKIGIQALFEDANFQAGIARYQKSVKEASTMTERAAGEISKSTEGIGQSFDDAAGRVGKYAAALGAVLSAVMTKVTLTAARTEEMGIVLGVVGKNIGKTAEEMHDYEQGVKDMGIETQAARQALVQMVQAQIDLSHATKLARLAQDAAVVAQLDSSEAFERLVTIIQRGSTVMARTLGLVVDFQGAYTRAAEATGKLTTELTAAEKIEIRAQEVLRNSSQIAGVYTAAMESAGKQLRTLAGRYVKEAANALGEHLLPAMGQAVHAAGAMLKAFQALPPEIQATLAQVGAASAGILTLGGAALMVIPKIAGLVGAMQALGGISVFGPVGMIAALGAAAIYLHNLEEAHKDEAAAVGASSKHYNDYTVLLRDAGVEAHGLTQELYELAKAHAAESDAVDKADVYRKMADAQEALAHAMERAYEAGDLAGEGIAEFAKQELEALVTTDEYAASIVTETGYLRELAEVYGLTDEKATTFLLALREKAKVHLLNVDATRRETVVLDDYDDSLGLTREEVDRLTAGMEISRAEMGLSAEAVKKLADAYAVAAGMIESFYSGLADGITKLHDLDAAAQQSGQGYEDALAELGRKGRHVYDGLSTEFEESLPKATTVAERLGMVEDAWDEWALRMGALLDGVQTETEQGWLDTITAAVEGTDLAFQAGEESLQQWIQRLIQAFYAGELPQLIMEQAGAWQENAALTAEAQAQQTAAVEAQVAKRKAAIADETAALKAAREEQLAAETAARDRAMLELALDLAESSGLLRQWAEVAMGPAFADVADTAGEVLGLLDSGMISLEGSLAELVKNMMAGIQDVMAETEGQAESSEEALRGIVETVDQEAARAEAALQKALDLSQYLTDEDVQAMKDAGLDVGQGIGDAVEEGLPEDPFGGLISAFQGASDSIMRSSGLMSAAMEAIPDEVQTEISERGGEATLDMLKRIKEAVNAIPKDVDINIDAEYNAGDDATEWTPSINLAHALEDIVDYVDKNFPLIVGLTMPPMNIEMLGAGSGMNTLDQLAKLGDVIKTLVDGLMAIMAYSGGMEGAAERFEEDLTKALDIIVRAIKSVNVQFMVFMQDRPGPSLSDILRVMQEAVDALEGLAGYIGMTAEDMAKFVQDLDIALEAMYQAAGRWNKKAYVVELFTEHLAGLAQALKLTVEGMLALEGYSGVGREVLEQFADDVFEMVDLMESVAAEFESQGLAAAARFTATAGLIGTSIGQAAGGMAELAKFGGVSQAALDAFRRDLPLVVAGMVEIADEFETEGVEAAERFADSAGAIAGSVGRAIDGLVKVAGYRGVDVSLITLVADDVWELTKQMSAAADMLGPEDTTKLLNMANMLVALGGGIEAGLDALIGVAGYRGGIGAGLEAFISDLLLLIETLQDVGDALPWWMLPGSPTPLELGLRGIGGALQNATLMLPPAMQSVTKTVNLNFPNTTISNGMDMAAFGATIRREVRNELSSW